MMGSTQDDDFSDAFIRHREGFSDDDHEKAKKAAKALTKDRAFADRGKFRLDMETVNLRLPRAAKIFSDNYKLILLAEDKDELGGWTRVRETVDALQSSISQIHEPWRTLLDMKLEEVADAKGLKRRQSQLQIFQNRLNDLKIASTAMIKSASKTFKRRQGRPSIRADVAKTTPILMRCWQEATLTPVKSSFDMAGPDEFRSLDLLFIQKVLQSFDPKVTRSEIMTAVVRAKGSLDAS